MADQRALFEAWLSGGSPPSKPFDRPGGEYSFMAARIGWKAWQAALAQQANAGQDARDAARYRWLRQFPNNIGAAVYGPTGGLLRRDEYLDAAIDEAIAQQPVQHGGT